MDVILRDRGTGTPQDSRRHRLHKGGGPDSRQRGELGDALHGLPAPPTAILTNSTAVRGIITSLTWLLKDPEIATFAPDDLDSALGHINCGNAIAMRRWIVKTLLISAGELGLELPSSFAQATAEQ